MTRYLSCSKGSINGEISIVGDKSLTHRALMLSAISDGKSTISNANICDDTMATISCLRTLGATIKVVGTMIEVYSIQVPNDFVVLNCGNSGTTARLLCGIVCGLGITAKFIGDSSLSKRPMRMIEPLRQMGAEIEMQQDCLFVIKPAKLHSINYNLAIASAQVKSSILFASLFASGETTLTESAKSRNHSELMLKYLGANIKINDNIICVSASKLKSCDIVISGDISQASFFIALASCIKDSSLLIKNVNINKSRSGLLDVLYLSGLKATKINEKSVCNEDVCDLLVCTSSFTSLHSTAQQSGQLIDEIPVLSVIASCIDGVSVFEGVGELRYKESDRLETISEMLSAIGVSSKIENDTLTVFGRGCINGGKVSCFGDHRIAMSGIIAGAMSKYGVSIDDVDCLSISHSNFIEEVNLL